MRDVWERTKQGSLHSPSTCSGRSATNLVPQVCGSEKVGSQHSPPEWKQQVPKPCHKVRRTAEEIVDVPVYDGGRA